MQFKRNKVINIAIDSGFTPNTILLSWLVIPTNPNSYFTDIVYTDFLVAFSYFSFAYTDQGKINVTLASVNIQSGTTKTILDEIIGVIPFNESVQKYFREPTIGQGVTVPADGLSYLSMVIASDFLPSVKFKFTGSLQYRAVTMND